MDFIDKLKQFSTRIDSLKDTISTEKATKTSLIMPFFAMLGYDVFNPAEFIPEFTADVGIKKGEKVDYAILFDGKPAILVEAKAVSEKLTKHSSQLFRYFGTSDAKFAILTNGVTYQFFTDLEDANKMDEAPFLEVNMLDIKEAQVTELKKFTKAAFDVNEIFSVASDLKYSNEFKNILFSELASPSDDFTKFFLSKAYDGRQTQSIVDKFKPVLKKSLNAYISELMNDKIKQAFESSSNVTETGSPESNNISDSETEEPKHKIITTPEELEAYFVIKNTLSNLAPISDITYKDTESYMSVLYKNKVTNWICRLHFNGAKKYITVPSADKKPLRIDIEDVYDIQNHSAELIEALSRYL